MAKSTIRKQMQLIFNKTVTFTYVDYGLWSTSLDDHHTLLNFSDANYTCTGSGKSNNYVRLFKQGENGTKTPINKSDSPITLYCNLIQS